MYSMVLMAALTTGVDMPDRRGGCCGCWGGGGYGGCYGCWGGCYGGWGGCWGGWHGCGGGWGGCYGGWGGCYGVAWGGGCGGYALGGYSSAVGGYALGGSSAPIGSYAMGGFSPTISGFANSPMMSSTNMGSPILSSGGTILNPGTTQSFYNNPTNSGNEATLIIHVPQSASLSIDGQPTQQSSSTRIFTSPPLEQGKTYVYKITAEENRNGHTVRDTKNVEVRAGQRTEVSMNFGNSNRGSEERSEPADDTPRRNTPRSSPRLPPDDR